MNAITKITTERRQGSRAFAAGILPDRWDEPIPTKRTILVIDDVATNVALLSATLGKLDNVKVLGFSSGAAALAASRDGAVDLVFVDYQMPEMDGVEFIERFRDQPGNALVPVVVVTGEEETDLLSRALDAGAQDFLRKPVDRTELSARARSMLRLSEASKQLARYAAIDELTGLCNRRSFIGSTATEIERRVPKTSGALAIFDIDFFKSVNDRFGHSGGDGVLREVAARLRNAVPQPNLWGRLGGEEFGLLLPDATSATEALAICERARHAVMTFPVRMPDSVYADVTLSGGVTMLTPEDDPLRWLARADVALYEAKRSGRNCVKVAS